MATNITKTPQESKESATEGQNVRKATEGVGSPITNEAYNVIAALHSKLEGLEAYRKFAFDGKGDLWKELTQVEVKCVSRLVDELETLVKDGKFRMVEPGRGKA